MQIVKTNAVKINIKGPVGLKPEPILWCRQGMFCIIPIQIIQNAIDNLKMQKRYSGKISSPLVFFTWNQGIPVDPKIGYALLGEESNNQP